MKLTQVVATDPQTNEKQIFTFATANQGKRVIADGCDRLNTYLGFVFDGGVDCAVDIDVEFDVDGTKYLLARHHENDTEKTTLKKLSDGIWQEVDCSDAVEYVENIIGERLTDMLQTEYVSDKSVNGFHGDMTEFAGIRMLANVQQSAVESVRQVNDMRSDAVKQMQQYDSEQDAVTVEQLHQINTELDELISQLADATAELWQLKAQRSTSRQYPEVLQELHQTQQKYDELLSHQDEVDKVREQLKLREEIDLLVPKVRRLRDVAGQRAEYEAECSRLADDLQWSEKELESIAKQLDEKQRQYADSQDVRTRIGVINEELTYVASLYEQNRQLDQELTALKESRQQLTEQKEEYCRKLELLDLTIDEVKQRLDEFCVPDSVDGRLEGVRVDVKIDEVATQIENLQNEIIVKESRIAEKESDLVVQRKQFRSVAELDVAVTPIKAKDTILQVLNAKYAKLEMINTSLQEKLRNLERASEDYRYRISQLEQSRAKLQEQYDKIILRKQEEYKRQVFLGCQGILDNDGSGTFVPTVDFHDRETESLRQEMDNRNMDRDMLLERAYSVEGAIKEIKRHIEVNLAEMEVLLGEKANINNRYKEIVEQNSSAMVFNYIKALNSDNGTKYLLDVQQDVVRSEVELAEAKHSVEVMRAKLSNLKSRMGHLEESRRQLEGISMPVDTLVNSNNKFKDDLADIWGKLADWCEQYKSESHRLETVVAQLEEINSTITEISQTIKLNESQIVASTDKVKKFAGNDDLQQAVAELRYQIGDVEAECQVLAESKQNTEKEVFGKRLELEKTQWLYQSVCKEYDELCVELQSELALRGLDMDKIGLADLTRDVEEYRAFIAKYDSSCKDLLARLESLRRIGQADSVVAIDDSSVADKQSQIDQLKQRIAELEQLRKQQTEQYVVVSDKRVRISAAVAQARTLDALKSTLANNSIVGVLIDDKVNSVLTLATQYASALIGENCTISHKNYRLSVCYNGGEFAYDDLPDNVKTAVYIGIILSVPNVDSSAGRWLVLKENICVDTTALANVLLNIDNVSYVVDYTKIKGE